MQTQEAKTKKIVWIIDDDPIVHLTTGMIWERNVVGSRLVQFESGEEVVEKLENKELIPPDFVLIDINMPGMDGWEVFTELKKRLDNNVKFMVLSSSNDFSDKRRAFELGFNDYIEKPFHFSKIQSFINQWLL